MSQHTVDELEAVRGIGAVPPPGDLVLQRARRQLRASIDAAATTDAAPAAAAPAPAPRAGVLSRASGRGRRAALVLATAAAAAVAVAAPAVLPLGGGSTPVATAEASVFLQSVADRAAAQQGDWRDAAFWYSRSRGQQDGEPVSEDEVWLGRRGDGWMTSTRRPRPMNEALPGPAEFYVGGGSSTTWDGLWALPTEPGALEKILRDGRNGAGPDADTELFVAVGDLLRGTPAPPALRSALYRVAARVPGVELVGPVTDREGRRGVAVQRTDSDTTDRYVVDPDDGRLLEESKTCTVTGPDCRGYWATYLEEGPVDTVRARP